MRDGSDRSPRKKRYVSRVLRIMSEAVADQKRAAINPQRDAVAAKNEGVCSRRRSGRRCTGLCS